jgi:hypothetical protein
MQNCKKLLEKQFYFSNNLQILFINIAIIVEDSGIFRRFVIFCSQFNSILKFERKQCMIMHVSEADGPRPTD